MKRREPCAKGDSRSPPGAPWTTSPRPTGRAPPRPCLMTLAALLACRAMSTAAWYTLIFVAACTPAQLVGRLDYAENAKWSGEGEPVVGRESIIVAQARLRALFRNLHIQTRGVHRTEEYEVIEEVWCGLRGEGAAKVRLFRVQRYDERGLVTESEWYSSNTDEVDCESRAWTTVTSIDQSLLEAFDAIWQLGTGLDLQRDEELLELDAGLRRLVESPRVRADMSALLFVHGKTAPDRWTVGDRVFALVGNRTLVVLSFERGRLVGVDLPSRGALALLMAEEEAALDAADPMASGCDLAEHACRMVRGDDATRATECRALFEGRVTVDEPHAVRECLREEASAHYEAALAVGERALGRNDPAVILLALEYAWHLTVNGNDFTRADTIVHRVLDVTPTELKRFRLEPFDDAPWQRLSFVHDLSAFSNLGVDPVLGVMLHLHAVTRFVAERWRSIGESGRADLLIRRLGELTVSVITQPDTPMSIWLHDQSLLRVTLLEIALADASAATEASKSLVDAALTVLSFVRDFPDDQRHRTRLMDIAEKTVRFATELADVSIGDSLVDRVHGLVTTTLLDDTGLTKLFEPAIDAAVRSGRLDRAATLRARWTPIAVNIAASQRILADIEREDWESLASACKAIVRPEMLRRTARTCALGLARAAEETTVADASARYALASLAFTPVVLPHDTETPIKAFGVLHRRAPREAMLRARELLRVVGESEHEDYELVTLMRSAADAALADDDVAGAIGYLRNAMRAANSLRDLATVSRELLELEGRLGLESELAEDVYRLADRASTPAHSALLLQAVALLLVHGSNLGVARYALERADSLLNQGLDDDDARRVSQSISLARANIEFLAGNYKEAREQFEGVTGRGPYFAPERDLNATFGLAQLDMIAAEYDKAEGLLRWLAQRNEAAPAMRVMTLNALAQVALADGDAAEAREHAKRSLATAQAQSDSSLQAIPMVTLGIIDALVGRWNQAEQWLTDSIAQLDSSGRVGADIGILLQLAWVRAKRDDGAAEATVDRALTGFERALSARFTEFSLNDWLKATRRQLSGGLVDTTLAATSPIRDGATRARLVLRAAAIEKALAVDVRRETLSAIAIRGDTRIDKALEELRDLSARAAMADKRDDANSRVSLAGILARIDALERQFARAAPGAWARAASLDISAIQRALGPNEGLVEIIRASPPDFVRPALRSTSARYYAITLLSGDIALTDLGDAAEIDSLVSGFRTSKDMANSARQLYQRLVVPLQPALGVATALLVVPDGELALLPFEALVADDGSYLIERWSIRYLSSIRDLVRADFAPRDPTPPLLVGDVAFAGGLRHLRWTRREIDDLSKLSIFRGARILVEDAATKGTVAAHRAPRIIHLATHGFPFEHTGDSTRPDVLLRSGIALAAGRQSRDDGFLSAREVLALDLRGTELATLSACSTAVGATTTGQSVLGLGTALTIAGADSVLLTLWDVNDRSTAQFMRSFYGLLDRGESRADALRKVKIAALRDETLPVIDERLRNVRVSQEAGMPGVSPFWWAGFVLYGEGGKLRQEPTAAPRQPSAPASASSELGVEWRTPPPAGTPEAVCYAAIAALLRTNDRERWREIRPQLRSDLRFSEYMRRDMLHSWQKKLGTILLESGRAGFRSLGVKTSALEASVLIANSASDQPWNCRLVSDWTEGNAWRLSEF